MKWTNGMRTRYERKLPDGDDRGILHPDDVAEPDEGGEPVDAEGHREPVLEPGADLHRVEGDDLPPEAERELGQVEEERHRRRSR